MRKVLKNEPRTTKITIITMQTQHPAEVVMLSVKKWLNFVYKSTELTHVNWPCEGKGAVGFDPYLQLYYISKITTIHLIILLDSI